MKICALLVPRELKIEQNQSVKSMTDEQLEAAIEYIQAALAAKAGDRAKVIEGTAEPAALPAPNGSSPEAALKAALEPTKRKPNRLMMEVDTAIGPRERKPRAVPSPAEAPSIEAAPKQNAGRKLNRLMKEVDRQRTP
jgi:hypothetical protein